AKLVAYPVYKDVAFIALFSNGFEKPEGVQKHCDASNLPFAAAVDTSGALAKHFAARVTPTIWVINAKGTAVYSGAVDDSQREEGVKSSYLKDALDAVLADRPVTTPTTVAFGCAIHAGK